MGVNPAEAVTLWVEVDETIMCAAKNAVLQSIHTMVTQLAARLVSNIQNYAKQQQMHFLTILRHRVSSFCSVRYSAAFIRHGISHRARYMEKKTQV